MVLSNNLDKIDIEKVLEILEEQVLTITGKELTEAEKVVIKGAWKAEDYNEIACSSGYGMYYLQQKVGPPLWIMLTKVVGRKVKKANLKDILLKLAKKDYFKRLEVSYLDNDSLVGKTKIYGELPKIEYFYGRQEEINSLKNQIILFKQRCISITGVGGVGKSSLVVKLLEEILFENSNLYEYVVWKKVERTSTINDIVTELIKVFDIDQGNDESFRFKVSLLSKKLSLHKCLLVIDGFEALVQEGFSENKIEFEDFLSGITKEQGLSCTIIATQVPLKEFSYFAINLPILSLKLDGLEISAAIEMLHNKGLQGKECKELVETYRGNPSELEAVAEKIHRFFGGNIESFFEYRTTVISSRFQAMLHKQFEPNGFLNNLQKTILIYLANELKENSTPVSFTKLIDDLKEQLGLSLSIFEIMADIDILEQRSLVERIKYQDKKETRYTLQPVIKKYILIDPLGLIHEKSNKPKKSTQTANIL
ncbi:ATP-binding protein [Nostoc flagelliforme FACHB-838]|uniref:ATP-binding protein n=2 Tax=Nostoc flagelliforme TaxID=1306274 RepID=A0ABR8DZC4_9NOSO|nr:ATP-binding protein [Nostoc flagelliforme FACHB-838]